MMWAGSEERGTFWGPDMGGWSPVCLSSFLQFLLSILLKHIQCIVSCQAGWGGSKTIGHTVLCDLMLSPACPHLPFHRHSPCVHSCCCFYLWLCLISLILQTHLSHLSQSCTPDFTYLSLHLLPRDKNVIFATLSCPLTLSLPDPVSSISMTR